MLRRRGLQRVPAINSHAYDINEGLENVSLPDPTLRHITHCLRDTPPEPIEGFRAIVDLRDNTTFNICKAGYKAVHYQEIVEMMDVIALRYYDTWGPVDKKLSLDRRNGRRVHIKYSFTEALMEIGNGSGDKMVPSIEAISSLDLSLIMRIFVGAIRLVCTNGMTFGKVLEEYRKKHTEGLSLEIAEQKISSAIEHFNSIPGQLDNFRKIPASKSQVFLYQSLPFSADQRNKVEQEIRKAANSVEWNDEKPEDSKVDINKFELYNIYTAANSHQVTAIESQVKINDAVADFFFAAA